MQKPADKSGTQPPPPQNPEREARLAAALRENLKRRKTQARSRRSDDPGSTAVDTVQTEPKPPST